MKRAILTGPALLALPALIVSVGSIALAVDAAAQAEPPAAPFPTWERLPAVEKAATAAARSPISAQAWGDRQSGCYSLSLSAAVSGSVSAAVAGLRASLGPSATGLPAAQGDTYEATAPIQVGRLRGSLRVWTSQGSGSGGRPEIHATACSHNERAPQRCQAQCAALLAKAAPP